MLKASHMPAIRRRRRRMPKTIPAASILSIFSHFGISHCSDIILTSPDCRLPIWPDNFFADWLMGSLPSALVVTSTSAFPYWSNNPTVVFHVSPTSTSMLRSLALFPILTYFVLLIFLVRSNCSYNAITPLLKEFAFPQSCHWTGTGLGAPGKWAPTGKARLAS